MKDYTKQLNELMLMFELTHDNDVPYDVVLVCRNVLEKAIDLVFEVQNERKPSNATLLELINNEAIQSFFETDVIIDALHFVRIVGINALHGKHIKTTQAKVAYDNTDLLLKILNEKLGSKNIQNINSITDEKSADAKANESVILHSHMTEWQTRKVYIDLYLSEAGWEVIEPQSKTRLANGTTVKSGTIVPAKACSEIPVKGIQNVSGIGFCDYVLYARDGKPLAIVEAKKTSVEALTGQQQVREYGKCMEKQYGYTPILYYTNGYETYIIDGKYPPRRVSAFHTISELELMIKKRNIKTIKDMHIKDEIAGRPYQKIAITNICERFNDMHRRGLLVMATGTGKTRTAIALVDVLTRNEWVKNVLFLADRTSLVRQAFKNFQKLLPDMSYAVLNDKGLANEPHARITFSTHQTMINCIDDENKEFTIGRFDLIIIDEAHRSIFNKYGAIFSYFDSLLVGLTATPKDEVDANTYDLFDCETGVPNFAYSLDEAVKDHYLVPYKLQNRTTKLMKDGVAYGELSDQDKAQIQLLNDEDYENDTIIKSELFKKVYNKDTCRKVLDDLMTLGQRVDGGQRIGKTIIFAVNHFHAEMVVNTFNEMYPMYPEYCKLIDNRVKNSDHLIEEFEVDPNFRIAVSVDMLDTGIDVPSVLNLVFFKKVKSNIKLAQMVGRGTRLCEGLIDGKDKRFFYIFDYFNNFKDIPSDSIKQPVTIAQKLFEIHLNMMCELQTSKHQLIAEHREYYSELKNIIKDAVKRIKINGSERVSVRAVMNVVDKYNANEKWQYISLVEQKEILHVLKPLVESDIKEEYLSLAYDYKMLQIEEILIQDDSLEKAMTHIKKIRLIAKALLDMATISDIYNKIEDLNELYMGNIWQNPSIAKLEYYRKSVRDLMKYLIRETIAGVEIDHNDFTEDGEAVDTPFVDIRTYKEKVMDYFVENSNNPTIMKIKNLEPLCSEDFDYLEDILWVKLGSKEDYYSISKIDNLAVFIRSIVGVEQEAINESFSQYLNDNVLTAQQQEFIYSIINYVRENGDVEPRVLIEESPFDHFNVLDLFGSNVPVVTNVVRKFHDCVTLS